MRIARATAELIHLTDLQEAATLAVTDLLGWVGGGRPADYFANQSIVGDTAFLIGLAPAIASTWEGVLDAAFGGPAPLALEVTFTVSGWVNGANDEPVQGAGRLLFGEFDPVQGVRPLLSGSLVTGVGGQITTLTPGEGSLSVGGGWRALGDGQGQEPIRARNGRGRGAAVRGPVRHRIVATRGVARLGVFLWRPIPAPIAGDVARGITIIGRPTSATARGGQQDDPDGHLDETRRFRAGTPRGEGFSPQRRNTGSSATSKPGSSGERSVCCRR